MSEYFYLVKPKTRLIINVFHMGLNQIEPLDLLEQTLTPCFKAGAILYVHAMCDLLCVCAKNPLEHNKGQGFLNNNTYEQQKDLNPFRYKPFLRKPSHVCILSM